MFFRKVNNVDDSKVNNSFLLQGLTVVHRDRISVIVIGLWGFKANSTTAEWPPEELALDKKRQLASDKGSLAVPIGKT
jgi:hypothetical protein